MHEIVQAKEKKRFGNETLYRQIQQDALFLIESYGVAVSPDTAGKIISAMPSDEVSRLNYSENTGRFYITLDVIEECLERVRQGMDFWPAGFGTGGMAAYIVDENGPRLPESSDMKRLAELFGQTDLLTDLHSSFNLCGQVKRTDISKRAQIEVTAIDDMVAGAGGKLVTPTVRSEAAYDRMKYHCDRGYHIGPALSIISTHMTISDEMADLFLKTVTRGLPHVMNSMPIGGLTGPYSMTSLATLAQAQAIFGLVLGQLIRPGIKAVNAAMPAIADMTKKDMPMMFGSISNTMINILLAELNMFLGIPGCQSSCSHHLDTLDDSAMTRSAEIFSVVNNYAFHSLRHMFGFSSQLNDFSIENMERQISLFHEICANPISVELPEPATYDTAGIDTILEGFERSDFRNLDHTLQNIGRSFQN